jgi:hypothetical protein
MPAHGDQLLRERARIGKQAADMVFTEHFAGKGQVTARLAGGGFVAAVAGLARGREDIRLRGEFRIG